jgi:hypothetical protein
MVPFLRIVGGLALIVGVFGFTEVTEFRDSTLSALYLLIATTSIGTSGVIEAVRPRPPKKTETT